MVRWRSGFPSMGVRSRWLSKWLGLDLPSARTTTSMPTPFTSRVLVVADQVRFHTRNRFPEVLVDERSHRNNRRTTNLVHRFEQAGASDRVPRGCQLVGVVAFTDQPHVPGGDGVSGFRTQHAVQIPVRMVEVVGAHEPAVVHGVVEKDRKSTRLNSSHVKISYAVFC